jgi:hypothetical protein
LPVGIGSSSALVVKGKGGDYRDGDDGDFPSPLDFFPLSLPWIGLCFVLRTFVLWWGSHVRGLRIKTVALLTAIGEDHSREEKEAYSKSRGRRELLNLECSINYDTSGASSRHRKGKAHVF